MGRYETISHERNTNMGIAAVPLLSDVFVLFAATGLVFEYDPTATFKHPRGLTPRLVELGEKKRALSVFCNNGYSVAITRSG